MRSWPADKPEEEEVATPYELDAELRELTGAAHEVDVDNYASGRLAASRAAPGSWANITLSRPAAPDNTTVQAGEGGGILPILISGAPWVVPITTGDCRLIVTLVQSWQDGIGDDSLLLWVGVRVDGELVARSPIQQQGCPEVYTGFARGAVFVQAGTHLAEMVFGFSDAIRSAPQVVDWLGSHFSAIEVLR